MAEFEFGDTVYVSMEGCEGEGIILKVPSPARSGFLINSTSGQGFSNGRYSIEVDDFSVLSKVSHGGAAYAGLHRA